MSAHFTRSPSVCWEDIRHGFQIIDDLTNTSAGALEPSRSTGKAGARPRPEKPITTSPLLRLPPRRLGEAARSGASMPGHQQTFG
jgi:hypothetical protein